MRTFRTVLATLTLSLIFAVQAASAQLEQRCVLMVDRFQDPADLPQFHPVFDQALTPGGLLQFDIDTSSPAEQAGLSWRLIKAPPGMTIDPTTGMVSWQPDELQVGVISATVLVTDTEQRRNRHTFCVEVVDTNNPPQIAAIADRAILTQVPFGLTVEASDADLDDVLTLTLDTAPDGMTLDPVSGLLEWLPDTDDIGTVDVTVRAADPGGRFDTESFSLTVVDDNAAPTLDPIADRGARADEPFSFTATASDPDNDDLSWSLPQAPAGMVIDAQTGQISWTPVTQQLGPHPVTVRVADPLGFDDTAEFSVLVDFNRAPVAVDDDGYRVERGDTLSVTAPGVLGNDTDPNDDVLTTQLEAGPQQGSLTLNADGSFDYTPDNPAGTIDFELKWEHRDSGGGNSVLPLIANLDDDPASEILIVESGGPIRELIALDGATGEVDWKRVFQGRDLDTGSGIAVGDIDLDGYPEILIVGGEPASVPTETRLLYAFEHHGGLKWVSEPLPRRYWDTDTDTLRSRGDGRMGGTKISLADLDGDGIPEILVAPNGGGISGPPRYQVWDAEGRKLDFVEDEAGAVIAPSAPTRVEVVDLDLDGDPEIVAGSTAWSHTGELLWRRTDVVSRRPSEFPVVANIDDDPFPELIRRVGNTSVFDPRRGNLVAWNHDGSDLWEVERDFNSFLVAPITVADVDGDGLADILLKGSGETFEVLNGSDGSVKWSQTTPSSDKAGATAFDLDRDGFSEVLFLDNESTVHVWDGRDGTEKATFQLTDSGRTPNSGTLIVFADVDADGQAELVTPLGTALGSSVATIRVWESPNDDWAPMRAIWNQRRYYVTNVNDDLTIPAQPRPHWLEPGLNQAMINERLPEARVEESDFFEYAAFDGELTSNVARVDIAVLPQNATPRILSSPKTLASPDFEYTYPVLAVDSDPGETLALEIGEGPEGMFIDAQGLVRWTPDAGDLGEHVVVVEAVDSIGARASQNYVLEVVAPVLVPDLAGRTEAEAVADLAAVTLVASPILDTFSDTVPDGQVAVQEPAAGATAAAGANVRVEISRGPVPVTVPDLIGLSQADAVAAIGSAGLAVGAVSFANDPVVPVDTVRSQEPAPSTSAPPGSPVDIVVSGGPRALITIDPPVITPGQSATVNVAVHDVDGTPLDPQPAITLSLMSDPDLIAGTLPSLSGSTIQTGADTQGAIEVVASYSAPDSESIAAEVPVLAPISSGPNGDLYNTFSLQLQEFGQLIEALTLAIDQGDGPAIESLDQALGDLEAAIDLRRLRTMTVFAPADGMLPTPAQAIAGGLTASGQDGAYVDVNLELVALLEKLVAVMREGTAPDAVINQLNQELADAAAALAALDPSVPGVLEASGAITALTGTFAPRLLVADIRAVRQALRDEGMINTAGRAGAGRFTVLGMLSATRVRNNIIRDVYVPHLWRVAGVMGAVVAADLLQSYFNAGAISGIITGASQSIHAFEIQPSVIEGVGFDPTLSPNNAVTMIGPALFEAAAGAAESLSGATSVEDVNSAFDAIQDVLDGAENLDQAWKDANSLPMGVTSGCILDNTPGCLQLVYPDGFASVYEVDGGLNLPGPVLIIARNLKTSAWAVFVANFVPTQAE